MKKIIFTVFIIVSLLLLPFISWFSAHKTELQVAIIDKTVSNETFKEHLGITWILNHFGYVKKDGSSYNEALDYFGFVPNEAKKTYKINPPPASYDQVDVIYLADTYGVYEKDLPWIQKKREGSRSSMIYGGMEMNEWKAITARLNKDKRSTLIAEFNTLASPTNEAVRESMSDYLQLDWTGWTGRFFNELNPMKNQEIPQWIVDAYGEKWNYKGAGFILINDRTNDVVVLEAKKHFNKEGIRLSFTKKGQAQFGLKKSSPYHYWFDIVTPRNEKNLLAYYNWDLTKSGKNKLKEKGIPVTFAGVIESQHKNAKSYYFAGDYNETTATPVFYQMNGLEKLYKIVNTYSDDAFYWGTYVPMMEQILSESKKELWKKNVPHSSKKTSYMSRVTGDSFEVLVNNEWKKIKIKGVNIGMGKPGVFPGEAAITEADYYRWLQDIGKMGANSIRVYTLHPPGFYNALKRYNEEHENKIYVFHGVWINEQSLEKTLDAFQKENTHDFQINLKRTVDVIHGNAIIDPQPGHASGLYQADISPYVIGWIIGIEWYPQMVKNTIDTHKDIGDYNGQFFQTVKGSPFEYWLASQMDFLATYEKNQYNWIRPMSFTNWVTTDLLSHPSEPNQDEDLVSVNPNVILEKGEMKKTKQFASYHVYPYYPDFLNYEEDYLKFKDFRGKPNNYAAYLKELHAAHTMPILIAEFGVPASRGLTHENPFSWNQGFLSEKQQGEILVNLYEDILHEDLLGGLIFTWQDEWFKRTWNTMDYDNPNRRPFWSNAQTNEQQFGLLSFDRLKIKVDGDLSDWKNVKPVYAKQDGNLRALYMDYDERYLYFRLDVKDIKKGYPTILLDTIRDQGNHHNKLINNLTFDNGVDFVISLNGADHSHVLVDSYYDYFTYQYAHLLKMMKPAPPIPTKNSGTFQPIHLVLNKELTIPKTNRKLPFSYYETGKLRIGNGNPNVPNYDSLTDFNVNDEKGIIEVRIPWLMLNVKDPSQHEIMGDFYKNGNGISMKAPGINVGVLEIGSNGKVTESFPDISGNKLGKMQEYTWENWQQPEYKERLKQSYEIVKKTFSKK